MKDFNGEAYSKKAHKLIIRQGDIMFTAKILKITVQELRDNIENHTWTRELKILIDTY